MLNDGRRTYEALGIAGAAAAVTATATATADGILTSGTVGDEATVVVVVDADADAATALGARAAAATAAPVGVVRAARWARSA